MIIGNLPETQSVEDNDFLMLSKDNQKLLKIKKKNFAKGMGGGGGKGLKYWIETEETFSRLIDCEGDISGNGLFDVPGEAEITMQIDTEVIKAHTLWRKYPGDTEQPSERTAGEITKGQWIFKRTSTNTVLGGILNYKQWGANSRIATNDDVYWAQTGTKSRWDICLPGWILVSTDPDDVEYDFIYETFEGEQEVIEHVTALATPIVWNEINLYISGVPDPENYEHLFIKPREVVGGPAYYCDSNSRNWRYIRPSGPKQGQEAVLMDLLTYDESNLMLVNSSNQSRETWYGSEELTEIISGQGTQNYGKGHDAYGHTIKYLPHEYVYFNPYLIIEYDEQGQEISRTNVIEQLKYYNWIVVGDDNQTVDLSNWPNRDTYKLEYEGYGFIFDNVSNPYYGRREGHDFTPYERVTNSPDLKWFGNVYNLTGLEYDDYPYKDAIHYILHDAGLVKQHQYFTGLACTPTGNRNYILCAADNAEMSGVEPTESEMSLAVTADGIFKGKDFQVKQDNEWVSLLDLAGVDITPIQLTGTKIATINSIDLYAPASSVTVTPIQLTGTEIAQINGTSIYAPSGGGGGGGNAFPDISTLYNGGDVPIYKDWNGTDQIYARLYPEIRLNGSSGSQMLANSWKKFLVGVYSLYSYAYDTDLKSYPLPYSGGQYYINFSYNGDDDKFIYVNYNLPSSDFTIWCVLLFKNL